MKINRELLIQMKLQYKVHTPGQYGHMRKIWANEYMRQLGLSKKKTTKDAFNPNQAQLF